MISLISIWAVVLKHLRLWRNDLNYILAGFYWPILDIMIWGFLGSWIQQAQTFNNYEAAALLGILLWQLIGRGCNIMVFAFVEEIWSNNIVNLFSMPLRISEWMLAIVCLNAILMSLTSLFCMFVIYFLYKVSLWYLFTTFLLFAPPLFFSCIWIGFSCLPVIVMFGKRGIEVAYVIGWFFAPFSGAYYPLEVLPAWAQTLSRCIPMSYIFKGMREYVMHEQDPTRYLLIGYALSITYAILAILLFVYCFNQSKRYGLARLVD